MKAAEGASSFPFERAMGLAFALLRLSPEVFWALSPREFACVLRAAQGEAGLMQAPARETLDALMAHFPDTSNRRGQHG